MKTIAMFNNKGGVGKTTLTNNIASFLSINHDKRILVIDCDPQCNSTQLIMGEEYATELYWNRNKTNKITTISEILQPIEDGDSSILDKIIPIKSTENRFKVDLIPGDPKFSIIEDRLGAAWHDLMGGDIGGFRKTNWNKSLIEKVGQEYDFIFYDLGPSLGSINRSVLIGCDFFITPMGTDIFSILGIKNIYEWLNTWIDLYERSKILSEERFPGRLATFGLEENLKIRSGYLGYTVQQYITKKKQGVRRPTKAYEDILNNVPEVVNETIGNFTNSNFDKELLKLGDVPHLYSLIPLAQSNSTPIHTLKGADGLVGSQFKQKEDYQNIINSISSNILKNLEKYDVA